MRVSESIKNIRERERASEIIRERERVSKGTIGSKSIRASVRKHQREHQRADHQRESIRGGASESEHQ